VSLYSFSTSLSCFFVEHSAFSTRANQPSSSSGVVSISFGVEDDGVKRENENEVLALFPILEFLYASD
jgi:hypothetical protein